MSEPLLLNMAAEHDAANVPVPQEDATAPRRTDLGALVDTKLLGKPPVLEGKEGEYQDWRFVMRSYFGCVNTKFRPALKLIDTLLEQDRNQMLNLGPEHEQLSTTLYHVLSMTTKGKSLRIVQSIDGGAGYMAWWKSRM